MPSRRKGSKAGGGGANFAARSYLVEAIVLRAYKLGEADRIIVLLTAEHGQIRAVAKGIRRTSSKFGATLEPFMHVRAQIVPGKSLEIISQTQLLHPYATMIATDYDAYGAASAMVETAERLTRNEEPTETGRQFQLLYGATAALARRAHAPRDILSSYVLRALATAGWSASFSDCAHCGAPGPHASINIRRGGVVCPNCRPPGSLTPAPETIRLLAGLRDGDWAVIDQDPAITGTHRVQAAEIVEEYLQFHLEAGLHSLRVMDQETPTATPSRTVE